MRVDAVEIGTEGREVHLRAMGSSRVPDCLPNGDVEHCGTNDLRMPPEEQGALKDRAWSIESYHRGLKQCCGVEKRQARKAQSQWSHIGMAIQAFVCLEVHRLCSSASWREAVAGIVRSAIRHYLAQPPVLLEIQLRNS